MAKISNRVSVNLDSKSVEKLPDSEIAAILRAADDLIMSGGRTLLAKVLKGSKDKKVLQLNLNDSPVYGFYTGLPMEDIQARIDWVILNGYLEIEYSHRLPLLVYTNKGWEIEKETYALELLSKLDRFIGEGNFNPELAFLKERNREVIMLMLDKIENSRCDRYLALLKHWKINEFRKVRVCIDEVVKTLSERTNLSRS